MKQSPEDYREAALEAIRALRYHAARGDALAAAALVEIGNAAACQLEALSSAPEGTQGRAAADAAAADADRWPVSIPAIEEKRQAALATAPAGLGSNIEARTLKGTRSRDFDFNSRTGFAHDVFRELQADGADLPPLTPESLPVWVDAGEAWALAQCGGMLEGFPWPNYININARARSSSAGVGTEAAYRYVIREWLKYGFAQLVRTD